MDDFRLKAKAEFVRLLEQYRQVERWIKRAEQVNQKAIIPAMNELRYASRQLYNALYLFDQTDLTPAQERAIDKRLIIADQYLLNAEHDIWDAIVGYYDRVILKLDTEYGISAIAVVYPGYPALRVLRSESQELITEAREFYERRADIYGRLRTHYFPYFLANHNQLLDAEIAARESQEKLKVELARAHAKASRLEKFNTVLGIIGAIGVVLSIYLWLWAREDFCEAYNGKNALGAICKLAPPPKSPATHSTN